jgi:hypothetical protein
MIKVPAEYRVVISGVSPEFSKLITLLNSNGVLFTALQLL